MIADAVLRNIADGLQDEGAWAGMLATELLMLREAVRAAICDDDCWPEALALRALLPEEPAGR